MYLWFVEIDYTQVVSQKVGYACTQAHYTTQFIYNKVVSYARASPRSILLNTVIRISSLMKRVTLWSHYSILFQHTNSLWSISALIARFNDPVEVHDLVHHLNNVADAVRGDRIVWLSQEVQQDRIQIPLDLLEINRKTGAT